MGKSRRDMEEEIKYLKDKCIELEQELLAERHLRQSEAVRGYNGLVDKVATLEQERDSLLQQVFALHDMSHTYYGGCKCRVCDKARTLADKGDETLRQIAEDGEGPYDWQS